ncbi:MAG: Penicillin-binding protein activator LpoA [Hyphomicrobiaceae bacterium hypho_1]
MLKNWPLMLKNLVYVYITRGIAVLMTCILNGCSNDFKNTSISLLTDMNFITQKGEAKALAPRNIIDTKVALLLPLSASGQAALVAKEMKQAAEMALFESNHAGFRIVVKDTKGTAESAAAAAAEAISEDVELIIGPLFAKSVASVSMIAQKSNIPIIAFSNDRRVAGPNTYLLSFQEDQDVRRIVSFASAQGMRQFAAILPNNNYGNSIEKEFQLAVNANNGIVVVIKRYPTGPGGILGSAHELIEDIHAAEESGIRIDALFAPGGPDVLYNLGSVLKQEKLDTSQIKLLGTGGWDYPNITREKAFLGAWYSAPSPKSWRIFSEKFSQSFGVAPPRIASLAHNAMTIAIRLASTNPKGKRYDPINLTRPGGFIGADGIVRFTPLGLPERGLAILEVRKFGPRVISPAPQTFSKN